jgi:hypothetical protein
MCKIEPGVREEFSMRNSRRPIALARPLGRIALVGAIAGATLEVIRRRRVRRKVSTAVLFEGVAPTCERERFANPGGRIVKIVPE